MRIFVSLNLDASTQKKVLEIQNRVKSFFSEEESPLIKWEPAEKFHLTVFFIGDVEEEKVRLISAMFESAEPETNNEEISFRAERIGAFPSLARPNVLVLNLTNEDAKMVVLYYKICGILKQFGFESDKKFRAHITLGRVRKGKRLKLFKLKEFGEIDFGFSINKFSLIQSTLNSNGSVYKTIKDFHL